MVTYNKKYRFYKSSPGKSQNKQTSILTITSNNKPKNGLILIVPMLCYFKCLDSNENSYKTQKETVINDSCTEKNDKAVKRNSPWQSKNVAY